MMMNNEIIGIIGTGTMGGGIAQMFAEQGFNTLVWDIDESYTDNGINNIRKRLLKSVEKGKLEKTRAEDILSRINKADDLSRFSDVDMVIEAVIEDFNAKSELYRKLEKIVGHETVMATNTSSLSVDELSKCLERPARFLGVHFFNPPTKLELVEVISTTETNDDVVCRVNDMLNRCGKIAVNVKDSPGFIVNRLLLPFINEAAKLLDSGVADAEGIDTAMRLGCLHPAGPLQVADLIGLDICKDILEKLAKSLDRNDFLPAESIISLVNAGKLGRKTGGGFYDY
jgi:3-hydroxybutyryl-CoA dehydrogenase